MGNQYASGAPVELVSDYYSEASEGGKEAWSCGRRNHRYWIDGVTVLKSGRWRLEGVPHCDFAQYPSMTNLANETYHTADA